MSPGITNRVNQIRTISEKGLLIKIDDCTEIRLEIEVINKRINYICGDCNKQFTAFGYFESNLTKQQIKMRKIERANNPLFIISQFDGYDKNKYSYYCSKKCLLNTVTKKIDKKDCFRVIVD